MYRSLVTKMILVTCISFVVPLLARGDDATAELVPANAPNGWIALPEDFWIPLIHEPGRYFHRAHEEYLDEDHGLAAIDLREAAAYVRLQARRATSSEHSGELFAAANRLTNLARDVERETVKSVARLDREFARAHYALAEQDYAMARESWRKQQPYTTGYNLSAAVLNLESGYAWANREMGPTGFSAVADARALAEQMIAGKPEGYEVSATFDAVHQAIRSLSTVVYELPKDRGIAMDEQTVAVAPAFEPGWVLVEEGIWKDLPDSAGRHLHDAYEAVIQQAAEKAATALHGAIFDLELQAGRATGDDKTALTDSIRELQALLVSGDATRADLTLSTRDYFRSFADACYALARHHCRVAEDDWSAGLKTLAGYDLKWATDCFDRGRVWAGQFDERSADRQSRDARELSNVLIAGKTNKETDVSARIESLEQEIVTLRAAAVAYAS